MFSPLADSDGIEGPLVIEAEIGGHMIHRIYIDEGSSTEILYEHCFNQLRPEIISQMVPARTSLTGFSGETIWPLGQLRLLVTIGDADHCTKSWMDFMIVRSISPYNGIIGRPGIREIQEVPSTAYRMLKFPTDGGIVTIRSTILIPSECAMVIPLPKEIPKEARTNHQNLKVAIHLNFLDQEVAIRGTLSLAGCTELCTLLKKNLDIFAWQPSYMTGVPRSIAEHRLNIREGYSPVRQKKRGQAPEHGKAIQAEVQKLVAARIMREVYYHDWLSNPVMVNKHDGSWRIRLERISSDKDGRVGQNMEVYVDDLVIKSHTEAEMLRDVAEKSLPLFKTLKRCIKKSDFRWTPKAEQAFKQLKKHLSELPLLVAPKPKEELIVYLSASYGAVSAVLMTDGGTVQTPVYFISRAFQGPELNYILMEKLVPSLVFAAKRLRRYFQAHPIAVIIDQPIKKIMSRPNVAGRLQKWSVMLGEHNITYRPRTLVKGQILADFLIEKPDENPPTTPVVATSPEPWTLFTDGSSCVDGLVEYEALTAGLRIAAQMGVQNVQVNVDSKLVANQVMGTFAHLFKQVLVEVLQEKSIQEKVVTTVVKEDGPTWMTPIMEYLKDGTLPGDRKEVSKLRIKARQYELMERTLYGRSFLKPWQRSQEIRLVERENQSLEEGIKTRLGKGNKNWLEELPHVLWAHRTMIKSSHGDTPFSLTYDTEAVIPAEIGMPTYRTATVDTIHNDEELRLNLDLLEEKQERAAICEAKSKMKMAKYYNARVRGVAFRPRHFVYCSNDASHSAARGKLGPK
ncbi:reverse transcriptase domain-containing protein [Tanacetum coccineum]